MYKPLSHSLIQSKLTIQHSKQCTSHSTTHSYKANLQYSTVSNVQATRSYKANLQYSTVSNVQATQTLTHTKQTYNAAQEAMCKPLNHSLIQSKLTMQHRKQCASHSTTHSYKANLQYSTVSNVQATQPLTHTKQTYNTAQ